MASVLIKTSNGVIWEKDRIVTDIISAANTGSVEIDLFTEGPCCQHSGINAMLDMIVDQFGFNPANFKILTCNQLPSSKYQEVRKSFVELEYIKEYVKNLNSGPASKDFWFPWKTSDKFKKKFAIFIGRSNWQRLGLASYIYSCAPDESTITYHYDPKVDYHISNFGLEDFLNRHWDSWQQVHNFAQHLPMKFEEIDYPILWNHGAFDLAQHYEDVFCEVVCETYFSGKTFFITEKTFRCILNRRPFLVQGPKYFLKNLKKLGFKTFDSWWTEGYDNDPEDCKYENLVKVIDYINSQSLETIKHWYDDMEEILEHNYQTLLSLTDDQILSTEFYYE
jgi:hypothetical protein